MRNQDIAKKYAQFILPTYKQYPICLVRGKGSRVWDLQGKEYLDFFPGWAVSGLGHCHPKVVQAIKNQAQKILHVPNNFLNVKQAELARTIIQASFPGKVFFGNSGAEATDGAIKYARKYGQAKGRYEVISMKQSFHGRTLAATAATGQGKVHKGFEPLPDGFTYAEFNNLKSVEDLITDRTAAVFLEPVLGEGGVHVATQEFMKGLRQLCDRRGLLLILDEVQTGMGRTGKLFAYQHYGIEPDLMTLAKTLGGGAPIGALVVHEKVAEGVFTPGTHGSTYGGNPLVTAAALAVFQTIKREKLIQNVITMGHYLESVLLQFKKEFSIVREVRGLGLMRAMELTVPGTPIVEACLEKGLILNCTQDNVLRIIPAMNITKKLIDRAAAIMRAAFQGSLVPA